MRSIRVKTGHSYDIHVGRGILSDCGALAARVKAPCRVFLLSDETVGSLYAGAVEASFRAAGYDVATVLSAAPDREHFLPGLQHVGQLLVVGQHRTPFDLCESRVAVTALEVAALDEVEVRGQGKSNG